MRHLLEIARKDLSAPVPDIFPLASWSKGRKPLLEWLADELQLRHGWPRREARSLIWHHKVVAFLDGLDEVRGKSFFTDLCQCINGFVSSTHGKNSLFLST